MDKVSRVILADDHPIVRIGMRAAIEAIGTVEVIAEAATVDELWAHLEQHAANCDAVISDLSMPGGTMQDGLALVERLLRLYPKLPIVIVTATRNAAVLDALCNAGVKGVVEKGGDVREIALALQAVLQGRVYQSPGVHELILDAGIQRRGPDNLPQPLSKSEIEIVRLFVGGLTPQMISERIHRSVKTVSRHKRNAQLKLGTPTDQELIEYWRAMES
jgi:two-component system capsular synthesis response regulator RcsB